MKTLILSLLLIRSISIGAETLFHNNLTDISQDFIEVFNSYDNKIVHVHDLFLCLPDLKIKDGYVLDAYQIDDASELYVHSIDAKHKYLPVTLFKRPHMKYNSNLIISKTLSSRYDYGIPDWLDYIEVPSTESGIWQAFLMWDFSTRLCTVWHAEYHKRIYILSPNALDNIANEILEESEPFVYSDFVERLLAFKDDARIVPQVRIVGDKASISFAYWNPWQGLILAEYQCELIGNGKIRFLKNEQKYKTVLLAYNCGIKL